MKLPQSFTTVTKVSKLLALALFVSLPFIGFYLGIKYKQCAPIKCSENIVTNKEKFEETSQLEEFELRKLKELGLANPEKDLKADLIKHPELIPYEGVLGGTMGFYSESGIQILTPSWVLAEFEDGHVYGELLLKYDVTDAGTIKWEVIDSQIW